MPTVPTLSSAIPAGGGFLLPSYDDALPAATPSTSKELPTLPTEPQDPLRLSPAQLTRLRSHLDDRILSIQRRWAKRHHSEPPSSSDGLELHLDTVGKYLLAWREDVIPLLVRLDPVGASQSTMLVAYSMRTTELLLMGLIGYESLDEKDAVPGSDPTSGTGISSGLDVVVQMLHLLDALWSSILTGRRLSLPHALYRSSSLISTTSLFKSTSEPAHRSSPSLKDSSPLIGSMGVKTTSGTDRVRLRNLLVDRRDEVRSWIGALLGVILAGPSDHREHKRHAGVQTHDRDHNGKRRRQEMSQEPGEKDVIARVTDETETTSVSPGRKRRRQRKLDAPTEEGQESAREGGEGDEEEEDLEEVQLPNGRSKAEDQEDEGVQIDTDEHRHFKALFDRKIDPDGESEEDEESIDQQDDHTPGTSDQDGENNAQLTPDQTAIDQELANVQPGGSLSSSNGSHLPINSFELDVLLSRLFSRSLSLLERLQ